MLSSPFPDPPMQEERRDGPRYQLSGEFRGYPLGPLSQEQPDSSHIEGTIQNISAGGAALLTSSPVDLSTPLKTEVLFPNMPVAVTLLARPRWTRPHPDQPGYLTGLEFLLASTSWTPGSP